MEKKGWEKRRERKGEHTGKYGKYAEYAKFLKLQRDVWGKTA